MSTKKVEGQAEEVIFDHLHATTFQYTPLRRTILGPAQNIKAITRAHLTNYISTHYTPHRMVAGPVKHEDAVEQVEKLFTKLSADPITAAELVEKEPAVFTGSEPEYLDGLAYGIMDEISKLSYRVSEADVTRARNQLKSSLQLHIDGTSPIAKDIGCQLLTYVRRIPIAELFARIDAVDASMIKRVGNRFIFDRDVAIAAMGPVQGLPDYNWFRRRTYWLRY